MAATRGTAVVTLPSDTQILITREFDVPKHLVWRAWTEPDLVMRWWCGERGSMVSAHIDLRVGGSWRYVMTANEGFEVAFHGTFLEIVPDEQLVNTEVFEGAPDTGAPEPIVTLAFTETDGRTTLTQLTETHSQFVRDAIVNSGMEGGMQESMDALEQVAASLVSH